MAKESPKPQPWWQTLPGILTAVATIITATTGLIVALNQAGCFLPKAPMSPSPSPPVTQSPDTPPTSVTGVDESATGVDELERSLEAVNIKLSTGGPEDRRRVRGYFRGPASAYHLLAVSCLRIMANQRLKQTGHLDMIDDFYTQLVGPGNYTSSDGNLNVEKVKEAMVKAQIEIYGADATSFEQIVESR